MDARELLCLIALKYNGDWDSIYRAIQNRANEQEEWLEYLPRLKKMKAKYITVLDQEYPQYLRQSRCPPFVLFYYGDISLINDINKNVAFVGSRDCSEYGASMTEQLVKAVSPKYNIVSGLALGIDAIAHQSAIDSGGKTIAVLGGGIDYIYPSSNRELYYKIKHEHLILSEYPESTQPEPRFFPIRNRIVAMLSKAVVVTEAHQYSGTLITVTWALESNKPVICVPYPAGLNSECNRLIRDGSDIVESGEELLKTLDNSDLYPYQDILKFENFVK
ncbi:MAG: DNA-processing protein DprA [Bacilli bacterium]|nr:DNA-processing protein DprA [Bacilli bacterium]